MSSSYQRQILEIVQPIFDGKNFVDHTFNTRAEVRAYVTDVNLVESRLRSLRREIGITMQDIRAKYASKRANASEHPLLGALAGRKRAIHQRALERDVLLRRQRAELAEHEAAIRAIDSHLQLFDKVKAEVKKAVLAGAVD